MAHRRSFLDHPNAMNVLLLGVTAPFIAAALKVPVDLRIYGLLLVGWLATIVSLIMLIGRSGGRRWRAFCEHAGLRVRTDTPPMQYGGGEYPIYEGRDGRRNVQMRVKLVSEGKDKGAELYSVAEVEVADADAAIQFMIRRRMAHDGIAHKMGLHEGMAKLTKHHPMQTGDASFDRAIFIISTDPTRTARMLDASTRAHILAIKHLEQLRYEQGWLAHARRCGMRVYSKLTPEETRSELGVLARIADAIARAAPDEALPAEAAPRDISRSG